MLRCVPVAAQKNQREWIFGTGLSVGVEVQVIKGWFLGLRAGYEWTENSVDLTVGPNSVSVNPSGYSLGGELTKAL